MWPSRRGCRPTAIAALAAFSWVASGAAAHAECRLGQSDPVRFLSQRADDPRLPLSPQAREQLKAAVADLAARRAKRAEVCPAPDAVTGSVGDLEAAGAELAAVDASLASPSSAVREQGKSRTGAVRARLSTVRDRVLRELDETDAALAARGAPDVIRERARSMRSATDEHMREVLDDVAAAESAASDDDTRAALSRATRRLRDSSTARPGQPLDPARLPFRASEGATRPPRQSNAEFEAAADEPGGPISAAPASGGSTLASRLGSWWLPAIAHAAPMPDELAPNEDVQITPAIQALAASLHNHPLEIYDWVRNNVAFVPTYGSVQGSQLTLEAKRGNAFDTASLLIALLRAAGVAARYVVGTVEVPADVVMNWAGGVPTPQIAQRLLGQGGIPNVGLVNGGETTHIRMEHVWVEAWIDYVPGRGAARGEGDTWVPMDASFKRHTIAPPSGLLSAVPFDLSALSDQLLASGEYDPVLNRAANLDQELIFPALEAWEEQARAYMAANGVPDSPQGVLGGPAIVQGTSEVFAGSLPYQVIARATGAATLPSGVRHYVTLNGFASIFEKAFGDRSFSHRLSLPQLNSRRLGLRFDPATAEDAATLEGIRSSGAASIPVHLIDVVPVLTLDGSALATGRSVRMGSVQLVDVVMERPGGSTTIGYDNLTAGDEIVFGITGNGVSEGVVQARFDAVPPADAPEYLHQVQLHYWMQTDAWNELTARALGVHMVRLPSVGVFSSPLTVSYLFLAPFRGVYQSRIMDVKLSLLGAAGPDAQTVRTFMQRAGYQGSFMEAEAFDQFEGGEIRKGISAVQLIADATTAGIPVFQVTQANAAAVLPLLSVDARVKSDVSNAIAAGKTVLVPGAPLDRGPWRGVGYIIQDPATGAGAYLISGGANGGGLVDCLPDLVPIFVVILAIILLIILLYLLFLALAAALAAGPAVAYALALLLALLVSSAPQSGTA